MISATEETLRRGYVSARESVIFRTQIEVLQCFGFRGKAWMKGTWTIPDGTGDFIWFPKLYRDGNWHNELVEDGRKIYERALTNAGVLSIERQVHEAHRDPFRTAIVFGRHRESKRRTSLRYIGSFRVNLEASTPEALVFDRVREEEPLRLQPM